jgi:hypothetical protein
VETNPQIKISVMKKFIAYIACALFLLTSITTKLEAKNNPKIISIDSIASEKITQSAEANALLFRLDEIKAMDKSKLNWSEKRELRKEVRSIKTKLSEAGVGVYISGGALLILIILLIILL